MAIHIKNQKEIDKMRVACQMAAETLSLVGDLICEGMTGEDIDQIVREDTMKKGGVCAPFQYGGNSSRPPFPKNVCVSINDVVCHGIPNATKFQNGDIVNVDVTTIYDGWHGDCSAMFLIGNVSPEARKLVETTHQAMMAGISQIKNGARIGDIGAAIQALVEPLGYSVVRDYVGHSLGKKFHEFPNVPHFGTRGAGIRLQTGMTITVEPMINIGTFETNLEPDNWTVKTADHSLSAQFEHSVLVLPNGYEILTAWPRPLKNSIF